MNRDLVLTGIQLTAWLVSLLLLGIAGYQSLVLGQPFSRGLMGLGIGLMLLASLTEYGQAWRRAGRQRAGRTAFLAGVPATRGAPASKPQQTPPAPAGIAAEIWVTRDLKRFFELPGGLRIAPGAFEIIHPSRSLLMVDESAILAMEVARSTAKARLAENLAIAERTRAKLDAQIDALESSNAD